MSIRKKKNLKPIDVDAHFKYRCPNDDCGSLYWISLKESQTKNFKIVCDDCGSIFIPKRIKDIHINFYEIKLDNTKQIESNNQIIEINKKEDKENIQKESNKQEIENPPEEVEIKQKSIEVDQQEINVDLIKNCVRILVGYGFTDNESEKVLMKYHKENPKLGSVDLIKFALQSIWR